MAQSLDLELQLHQAIFDLYGLSQEEIELLKSTAPPRDP